MEDNAALGEHHDVIKQVVCLWGWLQQGHQQGGVQEVAEVGEALGDEEGGGAVQAGADFVHEQHFFAAHDDFTCQYMQAEVQAWESRAET